MGKKYIIEKDDNESIWSIYADKDGDATIEGVSLTPYTEPDLEQVRKEGYEKGLSDVWKCIDEIHRTSLKKQEEEYQRGLADAWEAARKIVLDTDKGGIPLSKLKQIFHKGLPNEIIGAFSVAKAIEKIRQYEQEKEEIKVGDEVAFRHDYGPDIVVVVTYIGQDGFIDCMDGRGRQYAHKDLKRCTKTGRTFPEIAEVLRKMKEADNG